MHPRNVAGYGSKRLHKDCRDNVGKDHLSSRDWRQPAVPVRIIPVDSGVIVPRRHEGVVGSVSVMLLQECGMRQLADRFVQSRAGG